MFRYRIDDIISLLPSTCVSLRFLLRIQTIAPASMSNRWVLPVSIVHVYHLGISALIGGKCFRWWCTALIQRRMAFYWCEKYTQKSLKPVGKAVVSIFTFQSKTVADGGRAEGWTNVSSPAICFCWKFELSATQNPSWQRKLLLAVESRLLFFDAMCHVRLVWNRGRGGRMWHCEKKGWTSFSESQTNNLRRD